MKINKISATIQKWAKNIAQNDKAYDRLNNKILPISESLFAGGMYAYFIEHNDNLEKERKPALQYQNIFCTLGGIGLSSAVNKSIQKHQMKIIEELKKNKSIQKPEQLINGLKIAMPLVVFTSIIRFLIPVISTPISSKINEVHKRKRLDIKG